MDQQSQQYLKAMGIQVWHPRTQASATPPVVENEQAATITPDDNTQWGTLREKVMGCTACDLHKTRTHIVFGVGNQQADLMIIGEAPGHHEDKQGEPFVGRAGQLLTNMLSATGFEREDVYIANILKCSPPNNRDPKPEETDLCTDFLTQQIQLLQPKAICAVGRIAAQFLLETEEALGKLRLTTHTYGKLNTPLFITYHPAYLLRSPEAKGKAYQDLLRLKEHVGV
jgi:uracil-DNA glycosylase family 4